MCKKVQPQVTKGQVARSGHSKKRVSDFEAARWPRYPTGFKLSAFHKVMDTYNLYLSFFLCVCDLRSGQFRDLYIMSMGKNYNRSYWMIMSENRLNPS